MNAPANHLAALTLVSVDSLFHSDLDDVAYQPVGNTAVQRCMKSLPVPLTIGHFTADFIPFEFCIEGQIRAADCTLRSSHYTRQAPSLKYARQCALSFWLEPRRHHASVNEWDRMVGTIERLAGKAGRELDLSALIQVDPETETPRLRLRGTFHRRSRPEPKGFPIYDADGSRIMLRNHTQVPFGAAVRVVFHLQYEEATGRNSDGFVPALKANMVQLSLV